MRSIEEILQGLDQLFEAHKIEEVEGYLEAALNESKENSQYEAIITIVNELIGFYRDTSQYEKSLAYCRQILPFMEDLGLKGTIHYATTCLNIANACRAAGEWQASLSFYDQVMEIYKNILPVGHELFASYFNNLSLLYQEMGDFEKAAEALKQALTIIEAYQDEIKIATTCSNLAGSLMRVDRLEEAEVYLNRSLSIYIQDGERDFHYGAALSAMGELQFRKRNYVLAHQYYSKALAELEKHVGKTEYYTRTLENITMVEQAMEEGSMEKTATGKTSTGNTSTEKIDTKRTFVEKTSGMRQCLDFYNHYGKVMLEEKFAAYLDKIAVVIVGEGSHCFGYDDSLSTDHDFYPGFSLLVTKETYDKIGPYLQAEYVRLEEKMLTASDRKGKIAQGRTGVCIIEEFYKNILGGITVPQNNEQWLSMEEALLATAVNGVVVTDSEGFFSYYRNQLLSYYPEEVWKRKLSQQLYHLSQYGQYNYGRMMTRGDQLTASQCRSFFIDSAMKTVYLLNKVYAPYYKWLYRGMDTLDSFTVKEKVEKLISLPIDNIKENQKLIEEICLIFLKQMESSRLITVREQDTYLDHYINQLLSVQEHRPTKEELVDKLVLLEWKAFDTVENQGGRAQCQDDWPTFTIMRKSQYLPWTEEMLESYIQDFEAAKEKGWNLITEKYGRMMESTQKEEFERFKSQIPELDEEKKIIIEEIVKIQVKWMEEFAKKYPYMAGNSRVIHTADDSVYETSYETYLRGEISTYSDRTLDLYGRFIVSYLQEDKNLTVDIMNNTAVLYGYQGLEEAEIRLSRSLS